MDFFKVQVMTWTGPVRYSVLVILDLRTRHVEVADIVREAYEKWTMQVLRNLTDAVDGFLLTLTETSVSVALWPRGGGVLSGSMTVYSRGQGEDHDRRTSR